MAERPARVRSLADTAAVVRRDERLVLLLLSAAALAVFLHYTTLILGGLPDPIPGGPFRP